EACDREDADFELEVRGALTRLLCQLERHRPPEEPAKARHILRDNERIRMMMNYVQQHYAEDLTTAQIAGSAMISISECLRCFHNTIGMTPIAYLKRYRIRQAVEALADPRKKISQIAIECGFQEMSYFAKAFREIMGVTPSQYRKNREKTI
ncbi:MAG: helix-turn-helix transcriptional regulator, partial [Oscillospiraceae bacterium]|nr:helix-turn-helix transcriptional regulator [Oscillospiraceae bacterium]